MIGLARQNACVYPLKYGLLFNRECHSVWFAGEKVGMPTRRGDTRVCRVKQGSFSAEEPLTDDSGMETEIFEERVRRLKLVTTRDLFATLKIRKNERYYSIEDDGVVD